MVTKSQILEYWFEALSKFPKGENKEDCIKYIYWKMTGNWGWRYYISSDEIFCMKDEVLSVKKIIKNKKIKGECLTEEVKAILEKENPIIVLDNEIELFYFFPLSIIKVNNTIETTDGLTVFAYSKEIVKSWKEKLLWKEVQRSSNSYSYACLSGFTIKTKALEFDKFETDIEKNYNDNLPLENIKTFLKNNDSGLILFHGEPGTGKTSFLKHIISEEIDKKFIIIPKEIFNTAGQQSFLDFISEKKNTIFILEDCEKLLLKREKGASLETILNMSDGLLGSTFKTKFICTFNTDLENIDKALLRKGRLKVLYEFKKLSLEKTRLHIPDAEEGMTLAEIYNPDDNGAECIKRKKIGF